MPTLSFGSESIIQEASPELLAELGLTEKQTGDITALTRRTIASVEKDAKEEAGKEKLVPKPVKSIFSSAAANPRAKALMEAKASALAAKAAKAKAAAFTEPLPVTKAPIDLTSYSSVVKPFAAQIASLESENPYEDKTLNPILPMPTRKGFQDQIMRVYSKFRKLEEPGKEPDFDACKKMGAGAQQEVTMYEYQKFVREYMRQASPYRGVLVYHGLGSGKTCSAIAAAEALMSVSNKKVIVMTPFSLRDNFIREITFCGFRHLRLQNFWVELDMTTDPTVRLFAEEMLGLSSKYLKKVTSIWVPDFSQPEPNFKDLDDADRQAIVKQLAEQITSRITFINYNGVGAKKLKEWACTPRDENGNGMFDDKVIVIDEIHNLIRLMQGSIDPYLETLPGKKRKIPFEPMKPGIWEPALCKKALDSSKPYLTNYKRGYYFYRFLAGAVGSKIIGLSGTPLINYPEELGILVNVLQGYIHTCQFYVEDASEVKRRTIDRLLQEYPFTDFIEVSPQGANLSVLFSLLPEGQIKTTASDGTFGVQALGEKTPTIFEAANQIEELLREKGYKFKSPPTFQSEARLPPLHKDFVETFIQDTNLKNEIVLAKRLQGTVSYYRGSKKELMPQVTRDELVRVEMTPYAKMNYEKFRGIEVDKDMKKKSKKKKGQEQGQKVAAKAAPVLSSIYQMEQEKQTPSYRVFSRQACNFAFPENIERPFPADRNELLHESGAAKELTETGLEELPEVEGENDVLAALADLAKEEMEETGEEENAEAEDEEIEEAARKDAAAELRAEGNEEAAEEVEEEDEFFGFPESSQEEGVGGPSTLPTEEGASAPTKGGASAPTKGGGGPEGPNADASASTVAAKPPAKVTLSMANQLKAKKEAEKAKLFEECKRGREEGEPYVRAIQRAKKCLKTFARDQLRLFPVGMDVEVEAKKKTPHDPLLLKKYSPKYAEILQRVLDAPGSSLVYSQFLEMEGIGIFNLVLDCNDFFPIQIEERGGDYVFSPMTLQGLKKGPGGANRYMTFTGSESREVRTMALKVFNARYTEDEKGGSFTDLPPSLSSVLVKYGFKGNLQGELCRVFCITSAGAEGLSLRNVRRVHIMEPYWNPVRTDQVKGRAVRICSHIDLEYSPEPEKNQRTVEVFTYCLVYSAEQQLARSASNENENITNEDWMNPKKNVYETTSIDFIIRNWDSMTTSEAKKLGLPVPEGAYSYVPTTDEYMWLLSERKRIVMANLQKIMKASAVDCTINKYENLEDGIACIKLPGDPSQYAFHPNLARDIIETASAYRKGESEAVPTESIEDIEKEEALILQRKRAAAAKPSALEELRASAKEDKSTPFAPSAALPTSTTAVPVVSQMKPKKKTVTARLIKYRGKQYLVVPDYGPVGGKKDKPLSYKIYEGGDTQMSFQIGTMAANPTTGEMTKDIVLTV